MHYALFCQGMAHTLIENIVGEAVVSNKYDFPLLFFIFHSINPSPYGKIRSLFNVKAHRDEKKKNVLFKT